jgi:sigma-B regulation protein RsbU (phosphoserine phosphatase)
MQQLESQGPPIGWNLGLPFETTIVALDSGARLFIFSDGVFEIEKTDGENWTFDEFLLFMAAVPQGINPMDRLLAHSRQLHGSDILADDFSMLEIIF